MIADLNYMRDVGNLPDASALSDLKMQPHLDAAEIRLREWIGDTVYDVAETEAANFSEPRDFTAATRQTRALAVAEAYLALAHGFPSWNTVMESSAPGAGGVAMSGVIGDATFRYMNVAEEKNKTDEFVALAWQAAKPYLLSTTPTPAKSFAYDDSTPTPKAVDGDNVNEFKY